MKRMIVASSDNNETVIRMAVTEPASNGWYDQFTYEPLKLRFTSLRTPEAAYRLAGYLLALNDDLKICDLPQDISEDEVIRLCNKGSVDLATRSELENADVGSGEPLVFSIRQNGKLIESLGVNTSYFGKFSAGYDNDDPQTYSNAENEKMTKMIEDVMSSNHLIERRFERLDGFGNRTTFMSIFVPVRVANSASIYMWVGEGLDRYSNAKSLAAYLTNVKKRARLYSSWLLKLVDTSEVPDGTPVGIPCDHIQATYGVWAPEGGFDLPSITKSDLTKNALKEAKSQGISQVYVFAEN